MAKSTTKVEYSKSPLIEAVFEVFFPPVDFTKAKTEKLNEKLKKIKFDFGILENIEIKRYNLDVPAEGPAKAQELGPIPRVRFWSKDKTIMFQYGADMVAVNALKPYKKMEDYLPILQQVLEIVFAEFGVQQTTVLGQRFINEITATGAMTPEKIFAIYPQLPEQVRSQHPAFALQVETLREEDKSVALNLEYRGHQAKNHKYLLDIYLRSLTFSTNSSNDIITWMRTEHPHALKTFEEALTKAGQKHCGRTEL